jgi:uncharacterized membrane protein YedE/YeeE
MMNLLKDPWPWYVAGILIGLIVPTLLIIGNKHFGISSNLRHLCAVCFPANIKFFSYEWKKEIWNFFFVGGIIAGAAIATFFFAGPAPLQIDPRLKTELVQYGIQSTGIVPEELYSFRALFSLRGLIIMVGGGVLVGFGSRYAGGCTSGHSITGLSNLQWPSFVATVMFMAGGFLMTHLILPYILSL